ncbi:competence type IV pilus minor pilin ComGD [Enterococcus sp. LJL98]
MTKRKLTYTFKAWTSSPWTGFTLLETLIVFFVVSLFVGLPAHALPRLHAQLQVHQFLNQFEKYTLLTQQVAILSNEFTGISRLGEGDRQLLFSLEYGEKIVLSLPEALRVSAFATKHFTKSTGGVDRLEAIRFTWEEEKKAIVYTFLLGKGHYEKEIKAI